ncbi:MAG: lysophospholipid acyltransferase family protein [Thermoanaerobaculia bacterium]|nr:lysophospholipid acyltransferase family protein [Thermoanaerobaculia bacterium]
MAADELAVAEPQVALRERALGLLAASVIRGIRATVRVVHHGDAWLRERERRRERTIYAFWHRHLLLMPYCYRGDRIHMLSSHHRDAEIIVRAMRTFGISAIRGSSTRGGAVGLKGLLREAAAGSDLAFTPDGPKGPPGVVKLGVIQAAALGDLPIQPIAIGATRRWVLAKTWDQFEVPKPFSRVEFVYGEPLTVPRRADLETVAQELARRLDQASAEAEERVGRTKTGAGE